MCVLQLWRSEIGHFSKCMPHVKNEKMAVLFFFLVFGFWPQEQKVAHAWCKHSVTDYKVCM